MPRESMTVQCYPSDEKVNETIARYESFGWELMSNQACQEYTGYSESSFSSISYNTLTFSREKSEKWYDEVTALEAQYKAVNDRLEELNKTQPQLPNTFDRQFGALMLVSFGAIIAFVGILLLIFSAVDLLEFYWAFIPLVVGGAMIAGSVYMQMSIINGKRKHASDLEEWQESNRGKVENLKSEMEEIVQKAAAVIKGYHTSPVANLSE